MDSDKLNRWLTLGANIGVLIGIIFLAIELQQNNENLAAEVRATNFFGMADTWRMVAESPELAGAIMKDFADEELSPSESNQLFSYWVRVFLTLQWGYSELPEEEFRRGLDFQGEGYRDLDTFRSAWERMGSFLDPEFRDFMNENVFIESR